MGFSFSSLAIKGRSRQEICEALGLQTTGEREESPESDLCGVELPGGWYLIISNREDQVVPDATMQQLSSPSVELVTCFVEEHVMCSAASGWNDVRECWSVSHDAQQGIYHLETKGDLPTAFVSIRDRLISRQKEAGEKEAGVDYVWSIPVELVRSLTGYRHDEVIPALKGMAFDVLVSSTLEKKKPFWKRVFGA